MTPKNSIKLPAIRLIAATMTAACALTAVSSVGDARAAAIGAENGEAVVPSQPQTYAGYALQSGAALGGAVAGWLGGAGAYVAEKATSGAHQAYDAAAAAGRNMAQFSWELSFLLGMSGPQIDPDAPLPSSSGPLMEKNESTRPTVSAQIQQAPVPAPPAVQPAAAQQNAGPSVASPIPAAKQASAANRSAVEPEAERIPVDSLAPLLIDLPRRELNGDYFVPKAMQRLLGVRTARAEGGVHSARAALPGRVIPDPNAGGRVEASVMGRIEPPEGGLPTLGQRVHKGDILAYVSPAIGVVDRTQIRRDVARLTNEIRAESENLDILQRFSFVPFREGKIVQGRMHLEGLRRERAALLPLLDTREPLRSPADGVVSAVNVSAGQVLQPSQSAFEIVDPDRLWIEASASEPAAALLAANADTAAAVTPEGLALQVEFAGAGLSMQQQSALLHYVIKNPSEGLRVGRPVTVLVARKDKSLAGVTVPHEAVVSGPSGLDEVWEHVDPEHFRPRPVRAEMLDGHTMLVAAGLEPGARVVVHSARLLAQYQ